MPDAGRAELDPGRSGRMLKVGLAGTGFISDEHALG